MLSIFMYVLGLFFIMTVDWWVYYFFLMLLMNFVMLLSMNSYYFSYMSYFFGVDILSFGMILLSIFICSLMVLVSIKLFRDNYFYKFYLMNNNFLVILLLVSFSSLNIFMFYLFFEISLIPVLLLIIGYGYQPERIQAGIYMLFYTLFMSFPLLVGIFYIYLMKGTMIFNLIYDLNNFYLYLVLLMAFLVKMPMFIFHLWLPKAHVEASISGSMILAGVMLKLGGYGILRVMNFMVLTFMKFNLFFIVVSLLGGLYASFLCLSQLDMKALIAYSSVVHMAFVIMGLLTMNYFGVCGSYLLMLGHGLCSSGMFCLVNICYERLNSRSLIINKGLLHFMPSMTLWWFLLLAANMAAPPTINLLAEISLFMSILSKSKMMLIFIMLISFFSVVYNLYLFSYSQHGKFLMGVFGACNLNVREYLLLFIHWIFVNLMVLKVDLFYIMI
uniref:NADH-ubiquinone oxidoreductase chain 4 n=1 Tax=Stenopsyche tienmushanensis TaxID=1560151 RepID=A0A8A0Y1Z7_9NEOP|nr:NADH dehydrogenase subunit 4 [Stenopsyche tienmushanensis]QSQ87275.1 NADH dehydrogenase subunit 4 [Stenopsyche tienmushanensis]